MKTHIDPSHSDFDSAGVGVMPPSIFFICLIVGGVLEFSVEISPVPGNWLVLMILGLGIMTLGLMFMMWGHGRFQALGVNVPTNMHVSQLVTTGAHSYSRNPMYIGFLSILLGLGIATASWWMVLSALPMALYLRLYVIPHEEAYLTRRFGVEYETYCKSVRRWI